MGAVSGAVKGAVIGSVVPGAGTVEGAVTGAVGGRAAKSAGKHAAKDQSRASGAADGAMHGVRAARKSRSSISSGGSGRKLLMAEFFICIVILGLSPLAGSSATAGQPASSGTTAGGISAGGFMLRGSATMGLFLVLGLIAAIGDSAAKVAAGIGGIATIAVVINAAPTFSGMVTGLSSAHAAPKSTQSQVPSLASFLPASNPASPENGTALNTQGIDASPTVGASNSSRNQDGIPGLGGYSDTSSRNQDGIPGLGGYSDTSSDGGTS